MLRLMQYFDAGWVSLRISLVATRGIDQNGNRRFDNSGGICCSDSAVNGHQTNNGRSVATKFQLYSECDAGIAVVYKNRYLTSWDVRGKEERNAPIGVCAVSIPSPRCLHVPLRSCNERTRAPEICCCFLDLGRNYCGPLLASYVASIMMKLLSKKQEGKRTLTSKRTDKLLGLCGKFHYNANAEYFQLQQSSFRCCVTSSLHTSADSIFSEQHHYHH